MKEKSVKWTRKSPPPPSRGLSTGTRGGADPWVGGRGGSGVLVTSCCGLAPAPRCGRDVRVMLSEMLILRL